MDDVSRGWRLLLILAACAPSPGSPVGISRATPAPASVADAGAKAPPVLPADFKTSFTRLNKARFMSKGHSVDRFAVDVYANAAQTMLVKEQYERTGEGDKLHSWMIMEKRDQKWRWVIVKPNGEIEADGDLPACTRCHDQAPRDQVFPITD